MPAQAAIAELAAPKTVTTPSSASISVLVCNDHPVFRTSLSWKLGEDTGIEVAGESASVEEALAVSKSLRPDAVIADLRIADGDSEGVEAIEKLVSGLAGIPVIVYSDFYSSTYRARMESAGAAAFVMKSNDVTKLANAINDAVEQWRSSRDDVLGAA